MTNEETRLYLLDEQVELTTNMDALIANYVDGEVTINCATGGWMYVSTKHLACTIYRGEGITDITIVPADCGSMSVTRILEMVDVLKLEEKWIKQAYLAHRYYSDCEAGNEK